MSVQNELNTLNNMDAPTKYLAALFMASLGLYPQLTAKVDCRLLGPVIKVHLERSSPAYAAWEDSQDEFSINKSNNKKIEQPLQVTNLKVGAQLMKLQLANHTTQKAAVPGGQSADVRHLEKIVISSQPEIVSQPDIEIASAEVDSIVSYQSLGQKLVNQELALRANHNPNIKNIPTQSGSDIIVSRPAASPSPAPDSAWKYAKANTEGRVGKNYSNIDNMPTGRHVIAGFSGLAGGAALYDNRHEIIVRHILGDKILNSARASTEDGSFSLVSDNLEGEIHAELVTSQGDVIARGRKSLAIVAALANSKKNQNEPLKELYVEMLPTTSALEVRAVSATLEPTKIMDTASVVISGLERNVSFNQKDKIWRDSSFAAGSQLSVRSLAQNHYTTVKWLEAGRDQYLKIYPETYVKALKELVFGRATAREKYKDPVVWGKITKMGFPVAGAKVSLIGDETEPTYFTGYIPDMNRKSTSKSGDFAFAATVADELLLKVNIGGVDVWPSMVSTYYGSVTQADVEVGDARNVKWQSYEMFTGKPVATVFSPLGENLMFATDVTGNTTERIQTTNGLTFVETDASENYMPTRVQLKSDQTEVQLPQFEIAWVKALAAEKRIAAELAKRVLIGHVGGDDYEVVVNAEFAKENIVYFNANGQLAAAGEAGGGFILFGLPEGLHTIGIIPEKSKMLMTRTAYIDDLAAQVLQFNLYQ